MGRPSCGSSCSSPCSEDSETPRRRTGRGSGISFCSSAIDRRSRSLRLETANGTDLLRVMIEVVELHLQRYGPAPRTLVLAMPPDLVDQRLQFGGHRGEVGEVAGER